VLLLFNSHTRNGGRPFTSSAILLRTVVVVESMGTMIGGGNESSTCWGQLPSIPPLYNVERDGQTHDIRTFEKPLV
jgi:hypothetical protein